MLSDRCPVLSVISVTFVHCDQTVGRIKTKRGVQVGLDPGHVVLDGDSALPYPKEHSPPVFGPYLLRSNGCMIKMPLGMELGLGPGDFVLDRDPAPRSPKRGRSPPSNFRPMFIVAKRLDGSRWYLAWM